jgi:hypothetical protein
MLDYPGYGGRIGGPDMRSDRAQDAGSIGRNHDGTVRGEQSDEQILVEDEVAAQHQHPTGAWQIRLLDNAADARATAHPAVPLAGGVAPDHPVIIPDQHGNRRHSGNGRSINPCRQFSFQ